MKKLKKAISTAMLIGIVSLSSITPASAKVLRDGGVSTNGTTGHTDKASLIQDRKTTARVVMSDNTEAGVILTHQSTVGTIATGLISGVTTFTLSWPESLQQLISNSD